MFLAISRHAHGTRTRRTTPLTASETDELDGFHLESLQHFTKKRGLAERFEPSIGRRTRRGGPISWFGAPFSNNEAAWFFVY